ncbi:sigma intracellular receptor 2 isoform X3 [Lingula anatina]|uniref:Sigma intracellular receptor 2 n=1 Tax=Lingula anatina TaxID=7574 RepID=A0A1S3K2F9_LINAN|nr:sigma intracellular receptor 2 isoform X3 [Lingula anatina]|eukprot:XP_013416579.1 sigma intracellular receptor 2 isoform X3 [Lingula anatina]
MRRVLEWMFFTYFLINIPIVIIMDSQIVFPSWLYPQSLRRLHSWYGNGIKDNMYLDPPPWYQAIFFCEQFLHTPLSFAAAYAFYKGNCRWIRMPAIIYSAHTITAVIAILYHIAMHDFSQSKYPGPSTMMERLTLSWAYLPFFVVPLLLLTVMVQDEDYGLHVEAEGAYKQSPRRSQRLKNA